MTAHLLRKQTNTRTKYDRHRKQRSPVLRGEELRMLLGMARPELERNKGHLKNATKQKTEKMTIT